MFRCGLLVLHPTHLITQIPQVIKLAAKEVKEVLYVDVFRQNDTALLPVYSLLLQVYGRHYPSQNGLDIRLLLPQVDESQPRSLKKLPDAAFVVENADTISPESLQTWLAERYSGLPKLQAKVLKLVDETISTDESLSNDSLKEYTEVALGGTFDHIHNGHRLLLGVACLLCQKKITIGLADGPLLTKKVLKDLIQPFEERKQILEELIKDTKPGLQSNIVAITEPIGPAGTDPNLQCLVVSRETEKGLTLINDARQKNNLNDLELHVIDLISDEDETFVPGQISSKMSSSFERHKMLGKLLKPVKIDQKRKPYIIGLTGGIASGKSSIAKRLENLGAKTINCDVLGHLAYQPGKKAYHQIIEAFGQGVLAEDGSINRKALGPIVFADKSKLTELNSIVWPEIGNLVQEKINNFAAEGAFVCVVEAAVLLDAGWDTLVDEVWVAMVPEDEAVNRILKRDNISEERALNRIRAQMTNGQRIQKAHVVLSSLWEPEYTQKQVERAWNGLQSRLASYQTNQSAL